MIQNWLLNLAYWILNRYNIHYFVYLVEKDQILIESFVQQVESKFKNESGEFKRAQVMRTSKNALPHLREREIALAIELAIQKDKL